MGWPARSILLNLMGFDFTVSVPSKYRDLSLYPIRNVKLL